MKPLGYDEKDNITIEALKKSGQNYKFSRADIRASLMARLAHEKQLPAFSWKTISFSYGAALGIAIIFITSSTAITYANAAKPGDRLFTLDQMTEKVILAIPMPSSNRARFHASIVEERLKEMDELQQLSSTHAENETKAVEHSQENLTRAVNKITEVRAKMETRGDDKSVEKIDQVLIRLERLAEEHEDRAQKTLKRLDNRNMKSRVDDRIVEIKKARNRAHPNSLNKERDVEVNVEKLPFQE